MNDGFYTKEDNLIKQCQIIDPSRIIIEYEFQISQEDITEGTLCYVKNNKIYCCSWFGLETPFTIIK